MGARSENAGKALLAAGIYAVLKRFVRLAATTAEAVRVDARRFEKASTHRMRHAFVRQASVDSMPIEVASELAGHASMDRTLIYFTQELARKTKAVRGMKRRVANGQARRQSLQCDFPYREPTPVGPASIDGPEVKPPT